MTVQPQIEMTVEEFLPWAMAQDGRFELVRGGILPMPPETAGHVRVKRAIQTAFVAALSKHGSACEYYPDGMTLRIDAQTAFEPDGLVHCGPALDARAVEVPDPVIVVEVLSPGTAARDLKDKLAGYFRVPSIAHYLIVDPDERLVIHHRRGTGEVIETRLLREGGLTLDPPGISFGVASLFPPGSEATP